MRTSVPQELDDSGFRPHRGDPPRDPPRARSCVPQQEGVAADRRARDGEGLRRHQPRSKGRAARSHRVAEGAGHRHRIAGLRHRAVQQHRVEAQLHRPRRLRRRAQSGVDHQHRVGQAFAQRAQAVEVQQPLAGADRRAPGHQQRAARVQQAPAQDQILGAVGEDGEALPRELGRRGHQLEGIGLEGVLVAHDFQLDPRGAVELARHVGELHRLARAAAAGGVGQQARALRAAGGQGLRERAVVARLQRALQAHGQQLRRRRADRVAQHGRARIAGRAEEEAARQRDAGDGQFIRHLSLRRWVGRTARCRRLAAPSSRARRAGRSAR
ncbi:hypothetical protein Ddc_22031 [Ditylenchus destructor]|nr:hypothetical protein Ddc_22031 [Ditylenchus destructor]